MARNFSIQFFNVKGDGQLGEALGSEGFQQLDGRLGVASAVQEAFSRAYQLRRVQDYRAFVIMAGNRPVTGQVAIPRHMYPY
jgi:hypothetical protein